MVRTPKKVVWNAKELTPRLFRYTQMSQLCCSMYGIDKVALDGGCIKVDYLTKDQLVITLDPLTELITDISVRKGEMRKGTRLSLVAYAGIR